MDVEVKYAVDSVQTADAIAALTPYAVTDSLEERTIYFFDTPSLQLFARGVILRLRRRPAKDEATIKVRAEDGDNAAYDPEVVAERFAGTELEGDANASIDAHQIDRRLACSLTRDFGHDSPDVSAVIARQVGLASLFPPDVREFFGDELQHEELELFGPIRAEKWALNDDDDKKLACELWHLRDTRLIEISDKKPADKAKKLNKRLIAFLFDKLGLPQLSGSKTKQALTLLSS